MTKFKPEYYNPDYLFTVLRNGDLTAVRPGASYELAARICAVEESVKLAREALAIAVENLDTLSQAHSKAVCRRALAALGGK